MGSYTNSCQNRSRNGSSASSTNSYASDHSKSTAPTVFSDMPSLKQRETRDDGYGKATQNSVSTYASTSSSVSELPEEGPQYEVVDRRPEYFPSDAIPSNPPIFADLFPSPRRLLIRHDDTTLDGNMNLRVDTLVTQRGGYQQDVILFHLRMYDLYSRKFSFRRYCRDSGREVCHSIRKPVSSRTDKKRLFRRSWNSVLSTLRPGSSINNYRGASSSNTLKRLDSGYRSVNDDDDSCFDDARLDNRDSPDRYTELSNTTMLEFSNYAHVEVKRRDLAGSRKYEYEYWSTKYQWKRGTRKEGDLREVSYHLVNMKTGKTVAHIVPEILTPSEAVEEKSKGGWVPPSSMWINDSATYEKMPDIAEYVCFWGSFLWCQFTNEYHSAIVATGLTVLVDDCINRRWHSKKNAQTTKSIQLKEPKRLFHRRRAALP